MSATLRDYHDIIVAFIRHRKFVAGWRQLVDEVLLSVLSENVLTNT